MSTKSDAKLYRLRKLDKVVGYMEKSQNGIRYKSKAVSWFMKTIPSYDNIDEWSGMTDKDSRDIFELDIVIVDDGIDRKDPIGVVVYQNSQFGIYFARSRDFIPLCIAQIDLFKSGQLSIIGHLYEHVELSKRLGINHLL